MMSGIKNRRRKNHNDKLSKHFQNAKIVIFQKSTIILEKAIQSEARNNNEKIFSHEFNENNAVNYIAFVEKKRAQNKNKKIKKEHQILLKKIKDCKFVFEITKSACRSDVNAASFQQAMTFSMKLFNLNVNVQSLN